MDCQWTQDRLVALQDGELSPSEETFVLEHLAGCPTCQEYELALSLATPEPSLVVPHAIQIALEARIDAALDDAFAHPAPPAVASHSWSRWLRRERDLSNGHALAYGFLLAACLGWGLSNWFAVQALQTETLAPVHMAHTSSTPRDATTTVPADQYRPASWNADEPTEPWR